MPPFDVNIVPVLIAAVINMAVGVLWYSPFLFGKIWLSAIGKTKDDFGVGSAGMIYAVNTIAAVVVSYFLFILVKYSGASSLTQGAQMGFWVWLGFVATTVLPAYMYEMRPKRLYLIYISFQLIAFIIMGAVFSLWV